VGGFDDYPLMGSSLSGHISFPDTINIVITAAAVVLLSTQAPIFQSAVLLLCTKCFFYNSYLGMLPSDNSFNRTILFHFHMGQEIEMPYERTFAR